MSVEFRCGTQAEQPGESVRYGDELAATLETDLWIKQDRSMNQRDLDPARDPFLTPEEWSELEQELDDLKAGHKPTASWDDVVSRMRTTFGWTDSNSDPEPREH